LPLTVPFVVIPLFTGRIVARYGPRPPILAGTVLLATGGAVLAWAAWADAAYGWLAFGLLLTGFGISCALPALVTAIVNAAPEGTAGAAGGLLNSVRQTGATFGVAAMGAFGGLHGGTGSAYALLLAGGVCAAAGALFARAR
jgi:DHA2 family methylenomycin A resistance protein-like MFS transporter